MVSLEDVAKTYRSGRRETRALDGVRLRVGPGEFVVIRGPSGSGKTTLLMTIAAMQSPTSGTVMVDGRELDEMSASEKARFRARTVGFVFQMFHLVPYLTVIENVLLAGGERMRATALLERLGMAGRASHKPSELSAGERQRTAVARALLRRPKLLLADEPTGNLDPENARAVLSYLS
ncbi:MAG: ABC transporter ATP-binding protein, partial [bacterium]|nr:ABC transporter ATP-binding protein [bacterium]